MPGPTPSPLVAALAAALIALPVGAAAQTAPQAPQPTGEATIWLAQAEAGTTAEAPEPPAGWVRHNALGFAFWLPDSFSLVMEEAGAVVYADAPRPGPGATAIGISETARMYTGYMEELRQMPPDTPATRGTRDLGPFGSFRTVTYDLRGLGNNRALLAVLAATGPDAEGRMRLVGVQAFSPLDTTNWEWEETRALVEDILTHLSAAED